MDDDEFLYRAMNEEDDFYMGDRSYDYDDDYGKGTYTHTKHERIGYSPMGFPTKQQAYFAWREDYDQWKEDNIGIPWGYRDDPPQWDDYWCVVEVPRNNGKKKKGSSNKKDDKPNEDYDGCFTIIITLLYILGIGIPLAFIISLFFL